MFATRAFRILPLGIALFLLVAQGAVAGDAAAHQSTFPTEPAQSTWKSSLIGSYLVIPYFEVDVADPNGKTLLYAIQSPFVSSRVTVDYLDELGMVVGSQTFILNSWAVKTVDLRDVQGLLPAADPATNISRGSISIHGVQVGFPIVKWPLAVDYFAVTMGENVATGGRALPYDEMVAGSLSPFLCEIWTVRFLKQQGSLDTEVMFYVNHARSQSEGHVLVEVRDQGGQFMGSADIPISVTSQKMSIQEILNTAGLNLPSGQFGTLVIYFAEGTDGGHVAATYELSGRLAVRLEGACLIE